MMLLQQPYIGYHVACDKGTLLKQLVIDKRFDSLAYMSDNGVGAYNKMSIMIWTHGFLNRFYCSEIHHAYALEYNPLTPKPSIPTPYTYLPEAIRRLHRSLPNHLRYQDYIPQDDSPSVFGLRNNPSRDIDIHMENRTHTLPSLARRGTVITVNPAGPYKHESGMIRRQQREAIARVKYRAARIRYQADIGGGSPALYQDEGGTTPPEFNTWLQDNIQ
jgi:hypothetical protein